ncbi:hypothetical protein CC86DRAFT_309722 [Ophiobolus disseminans]|uniref:Myb-like domain-containing protein n=1 Tax=Ophiobolus disseminans TaxID=1469910 RepID=A0A6A6ZB08_9PLEO|nr:hypothetical protein CC86DRAFT_309722 [Ophiobolus disseminans]
MLYALMSAYPGQAPMSSAPQRSGPMLGGPVLPAISELQRHPNPRTHPQFRPLYAGHLVHAGLQGPPRMNGSPPQALKRQASQTPLPEESPAKKQFKWTLEEDNLTIKLRGQGIKWDDIAKHLPGRSSISCRLRYQGYLEKRAVWDEEKKNKLARLYARFKDQMWQMVATEMCIPWRSAETMHWQLGEQEMSARANVPVFQLHPSATGAGVSSPSQVPVVPTPAPHGFTAANAAQSAITTCAASSTTTSYIVGSNARVPPTNSRRRADSQSRASVTPQFSQLLPQVHAALAEDLVSGTRTAPVPDLQSGIKREGEGSNYIEPYKKRRREAGYASPTPGRAQSGVYESRSHLSTGSSKSIKQELETMGRASAISSPQLLDNSIGSEGR